MFFFMPHHALIHKRKDSPSTDLMGDVIQGSEFNAPIAISSCLFHGFSGGKSTSARSDFDQNVSFYVPPGTDIDEGDKITDIAGVEAFEEGPFEVLNVRYITDFSGRVHHISCKLRGIVG